MPIKYYYLRTINSLQGRGIALLLLHFNYIWCFHTTFTGYTRATEPPPPIDTDLSSLAGCVGIKVRRGIALVSPTVDRPSPPSLLLCAAPPTFVGLAGHARGRCGLLRSRGQVQRHPPEGAYAGYTRSLLPALLPSLPALFIDEFYDS